MKLASLDRRLLLGAAGALGTFLLDPRPAAGAASDGAPVDAGYPSQEPDVVREVVAAAHARLDRVRELVEERPELANATWDWGFGDWESALGAASHMGRRDIAQLLLDHGARPDIFAATMLGNLAAVHGLIEAMPGVQRRRGPHGITLYAHAGAGGAAAEEVARYLESLGDADPVYPTAPLGGEDQSRVQGTFVFGPAENDLFVIEPGDRGGLVIRRGDGVPRPLFHLGGLEFHPSGAPSARIVVSLPAGAPARLEIRNPGLVLAAVCSTTP